MVIRRLVGVLVLLLVCIGRASAYGPSGGGPAASLGANALNPFTGPVSITGNQGNGSDALNNTRVNGNYPVTAYGAMSAAAEPNAINATTDGLTAVVTLSGVGQFVNGSKIVIYGAGAACSLVPCTAPAAPTGAIVGYQGANGGSTTSYTYKLVYCGANWDCTPASTISSAQVAAVTLTEPKETGSDNLGNNITMTGPTAPTNTVHTVWWRSVDGFTTPLLWYSWDTNTFVDWANHQGPNPSTGPFSNTPPTTALGQLFTAKILSGGGTTTLTLDTIPPTAGTFVAYPDNTAAFQSAMNACNAANGGTVVVPPGIWKVRTIQPKPGCLVAGASQMVGETNIVGTSSMDVFQWPPGIVANQSNTSFRDFSITRGRAQIASMGSAASGNNVTHVILKNLSLNSPDQAAIESFDTAIEEWWVTNVETAGGWYGWDISSDGAASYYLDKSDISQLQLNSAIVNDIHWAAASGPSFLDHTMVHRVTLNTSDQDPLYVNTGQRNMAWDELSSEGTGVDSPKTYQNITATCTATSNVYAVGNTANVHIGDDVIVPNCGSAGIPVHGTVCAITASTSFTLNDPACSAAINAAVSTTGVANSGWADQILFSGVMNNAPITNSDIGATSGTEGGGIRYEVNAFNGLLQIQNSSIPLVYDQGSDGQFIGAFNTVVYRTAIGSVGFQPGLMTAAPAGISGTTGFAERTTNAGGDINDVLIDTNNNGTGTYGLWRMRTSDGARTTRFSVDNTGTLFFKNGLEVQNNVATYGTTVTPDLSKGSQVSITVTDGVAWTLANPTNVYSSAPAWFKIFLSNTSGGAGGAITLGSQWRANVDATFGFVTPATGKHRMCDVEEHSGTLFYIGPCSGDISN